MGEFQVGDVVLIANDLNWHRGYVGRVEAVSASETAPRPYLVTCDDQSKGIVGGWYSGSDLRLSDQEVGTINPELLSAFRKHLTLD